LRMRKANPNNLKPHPLARIIPDMRPSQWDDFYADVAMRGIRVPLEVLADGTVIDGRHRLRAAIQLGMPEVPIVDAPLNGDSPETYMLKAAVLRRHLTDDQRAAMAAMWKEENKKQGKRTDLTSEQHRSEVQVLQPIDTEAIAAESFKVPRRKVDQASKLLHSEPGLFHQVHSGDLTLKEARKQLTDEARRQRRDELAQIGNIAMPSEGIQIETGDFREIGKGIPTNSIDLIFTDPNYAGDYLELWGPLGELAARVLKPGGFLLAYCGKLYLPTVLAELGKHLEYYWIAGKYYDQGHSFFRSKKIWDQWRPILIYQKPGPAEHEWFLDMIRMGSRDEAKELHDYGQSIEDAKYYIQKLTGPGEIVLDVCCGSGTILLAAKTSNRRAIGFDVDESLTRIAKGRLAEVIDQTTKVS